MKGIIGTKVGMTSIFDQNGKSIACTVVLAQPNVVTQVKTQDSDGYNALQLAYGEAKVKNTPQSMQGHFEKAKTAPKRKIAEFRNFEISKNLGDLVTLEELFIEGEKVSAIGTSKGKGFQGVVKRHHFAGIMQASHGQHNRLRAPGSIGASSYPSKVVKGLRMAGHMGAERVKIRNLRVAKLIPDQNLILIKGAIPGHNGSFIIIEK
ncbi:MAG: 50S ribosomal protein L3 [Bacteroidota bacterium]|nr:50S ribosomal protein L3 [Bacteroidota bacterium]